MKSLLRIVSIGGLLLVVPGIALAQPGIPHQFYGTVSYESGTTPDGLVVEAKVISGTVVGSSVTKSVEYGINPSLLFASKTEGEWSGETVTFFVDGTDTGESFALVKGGYTNLNLTVPGAAPGTVTTSGGSPSTSSGSSSGGGTPPPTLTDIPPAVTSLTEAQKVYDTNGDNAIDVLDFNSLIVHWGETGSAVVADFDGNGSVDVFDFNSLMVHWTA